MAIDLPDTFNEEENDENLPELTDEEFNEIYNETMAEIDDEIEEWAGKVMDDYDKGIKDPLMVEFESLKTKKEQQEWFNKTFGNEYYWPED